MRFRVIEGLDGDGGQAFFKGITLGVAPCLASNKERNLFEFQFGLVDP